MYAVVQGSDSKHRAKIQFYAFKRGLTTDTLEGNDTMTSIVASDPNKILDVIREAGGRVVRVSDGEQMEGR